MRKILLFIFLFQTFSLLHSQPTNFNDFFPVDAPAWLWEEARALEHSAKINVEMADSIVSQAVARIEQGIEAQANLMVASLMADYFGNVCRNSVRGLEILQQTSESFSQNSDTLHFAYVHHLYLLGRNNAYRRDARGMLSAYERALVILDAFDPNHPVKPALQYHLMQAHFRVRNIARGFDYFQPLVDYGHQSGNHYYTVSAYLGAGNIFKFYNAGLGLQYIEFANYLANQYDVQSHLEDPFFFISLGSVYTATNQHDKAMDQYRQGLKILRASEKPNHQLEGSFYYYIGTTFRHLGHMDQSIAYLDSSATLEKALSGETFDYFRALNLKGLALNRAGRYQEAISINTRVMDFYLDKMGTSDTYYTPQSIGVLADSYRETGQYEEALALMQKAIYYFLKLELPEDDFSLPDFEHLISPDKNYMELEYAFYRKIDILKEMYRVSKDQNLVEILVDHFAAVMMVTDMHALLGQNNHTLASLSSRFKYHCNKLLDYVFEMELPEEIVKEVYVMTAKSKSYLLLAENLQNRTFRSETYTDEEKSNSLEKNHLSGMLLSIDPQRDRQEYVDINSRFLHLEKDEFLARLKKPVKTDDVLVPQLAMTQAGSLYGNIAEGEMILDFFITKSFIHTFSITKNKFSFISKPLPDNFKVLTGDIFRNIKTGNSRQLAASVASLNAIMPNNISFDGIDHLIIVPDEGLHMVPFEIFYLQNKNLLSKIAVSYRYNSHLFRDARNLQEPVLNSFMAMAPVFDSNELSMVPQAYRGIAEQEENADIFVEEELLSALPATLNEVSSINILLQDITSRTLCFIRTEATKQNFVNNAPDFDVLHIATHGFTDLQTPERSGLFLYHEDEGDNTGFIRLGELSGIETHADLVVLSACKSGYGAIERGEGIMGISRGFIAGGANNVVASLWKVHDEKTKEFMLSFYSHLIKGKSYAHSLRLAKSDKIKQGWLPMDWAGFIIIGR